MTRTWCHPSQIRVSGVWRIHPGVISRCWLLGSRSPDRYTARARTQKSHRQSSYPLDHPQLIAIRKGPQVSATDSAPTSSPTPIRWSIVAVATLMSTLMYLDRFCVSFAQSFIQEDLGLTVKQTSYILSAFFWSYALAQIPSGWLSDRWGGRIMLTIYILSWSLFTLLIGWSTTLWFLLAMQLGHGLGQSGGYPTSAGLLSTWMPLGTRGTASSIVAFGGRLGGFLAPILTAWLIVLFVPVSKLSLVTERQLAVSEIGDFSWRLIASSEPSSDPDIGPHRHLYQQTWVALPADSQTILVPLGKQYSLYLKAKKASANAASVKPPVLELKAVERETLVHGLNSLLRVPKLVSTDDVIGLNLAREAKSLIARQDAGQTLTTPEIERLNRLLLEALFPNFIGKVYVQGWRYVFTVYGLVGIGVALLFWTIARNQPQDHPWCNATELALIQEGRSPVSQSPAGQPSLNWGQVLRSRGLWLSSVSQFGTNIGWLFVAAKLPDYLVQVHNVETIQRGYLSSLPMAGGVVGMLLGGRLTDWMRFKWGVRWGRAIPMGLTRFGAAAAYIGCLFANDPWVAAILCMIVAFFTDLGVAATWAFVQDAGGRYVGVVLGFGNMWGNIGAAVAPQIYGYALEWSRNDWNVCFLICSGAMIISGLAGIFIDASQPIVEEELEAT